MRRLLLLLFFFENLSYAQSLEAKKAFTQNVFELQFIAADSVARILDLNYSIPYHQYISQLFSQAGQEPKTDKEILIHLSKNQVDVNLQLENLVKGVYFLYSGQRSEYAFEYLSSVLLNTDTGSDPETIKLTYLAILELYSKEIVQSSESYLKYLEEFKELASSPYEVAWYHIHYLAYLTKSSGLSDLSIYYKAYAEMSDHFSKYQLNNRLKTHEYFNDALFLRFENQIEESRKAYHQSILVAKDHQFLKYIKFSCFIHLSQIEALLGNYDEAKVNLSEARKHWDKSDSIRSEFIQNRFSAYYYYEKVGKFDSAYLLLRKSNDMEPQLDFRKNTLKISELNVKLQTAKKENRILQQKNQIASKNSWILTITILLIITVVLLTALILSFKNIKSKNKRIELLMRELHHRVKNNLQIVSSLLGLQSMKLDDAVARTAISEGKERIRAMSLIHQKLYQDQDGTSLNISEYINQLVNELSQSYGFQNKVKVSIRVPTIPFDPDTSLPLGLIINEVVSNAFKYAYRDIEVPTLDLEMTKVTAKLFSLKIKDNGCGLPADFNIEKATSFGMKLIGILIKQLKGSLIVDNKSGLEYQFKFHVS